MMEIGKFEIKILKRDLTLVLRGKLTKLIKAQILSYFLLIFVDLWMSVLFVLKIRSSFPVKINHAHTCQKWTDRI